MNLMTNKEIEEHVKFRMGKWYGMGVYPEDKLILNNQKMIHTVSINNSGIKINPIDSHRKWGGSWRPCEFLLMAQRFNIWIDPEVYLDVTDNTYYDDGHPQVFTHNRHNQKDNTIIFPLHSQFAGLFKRPDPLPWEEKLDDVIWRGKSSGAIITDKDRSMSFFGNIEQIHRNPSWTKNEIITKLKKYKRYEFLNNNRNLDLKFTWHQRMDDKRISKCFNGLMGEMMEKDDQYRYKYLLALDGNDWPSNLGHFLYSNSVVLMTKPIWYGIFHAKLKAGKHYIEVASDGSDLKEVLEWCKSNDKACKEIAMNGKEYAKLFNWENEKKIWNKIFNGDY